jgi:hypothetical protein
MLDVAFGHSEATCCLLWWHHWNKTSVYVNLHNMREALTEYSGGKYVYHEL